MTKKPSQPGNGGQVFELTMDNTEDQDELNRLLRKTGEPDLRSAETPARVSSPADKEKGKSTSS